MHNKLALTVENKSNQNIRWIMYEFLIRNCVPRTVRFSIVNLAFYHLNPKSFLFNPNAILFSRILSTDARRYMTSFYERNRLNRRNKGTMRWLVLPFRNEHADWHWRKNFIWKSIFTNPFLESFMFNLAHILQKFGYIPCWYVSILTFTAATDSWRFNWFIDIQDCVEFCQWKI